MVLKQLFVFDLEWVPIAKNYEDLSVNFPLLADAWNRRCNKWNDDKLKKGNETPTPSEYWDKEGGFYPEFIKIICASYGYTDSTGTFKVGSIYGDDESELLTKFNSLLTSVEKKGLVLSGASIKRFDMPFIAKRMMVNGIRPSKLVNVFGSKPWEVNVYDLPEVWSQGCSQEAYTPFDWMCVSLGIETPKDDIGGADVKRVYYEEENGLERIKTYCEKDVLQSYKLAEKLISLS